MQPIQVSLEPNEMNTDGCALTLYFKYGTSIDDVKIWIETATNTYGIPLWVDKNDEFFEVIETKNQPRDSELRFQAHPTV